MPKFNGSGKENRDGRGRMIFGDSPKRGGSSRGGPRRGGSSRDSPRDRESKHGSRNRRDFEMTKVTCSSCGDECEVPFKPTTNKPLFCSNCFSKNKDGNSKGSSSKDLDAINDKLNKIMKALKIR